MLLYWIRRAKDALGWFWTGNTVPKHRHVSRNPNALRNDLQLKHGYTPHRIKASTVPAYLLLKHWSSCEETDSLKRLNSPIVHGTSTTGNSVALGSSGHHSTSYGIKPDSCMLLRKRRRLSVLSRHWKRVTFHTEEVPIPLISINSPVFEGKLKSTAPLLCLESRTKYPCSSTTRCVSSDHSIMSTVDSRGLYASQMWSPNPMTSNVLYSWHRIAPSLCIQHSGASYPFTLRPMKLVSAVSNIQSYVW